MKKILSKPPRSSSNLRNGMGPGNSARQERHMESSPLDNLGFVEIIFSGAVALGFGFWQLWSVNREIAKDKEKAARSEPNDG
jgi:hypothetical protein